MDRRQVIKTFASAAFLAPAGRLNAQSPLPAAPQTRVRPADPQWPSAADWAELRRRVGGRLERVASPLAACERTPDGALCETALQNLANPFFIQDQAGGTQSTGWLDGWTAAPSVYAVVPESAADVAAAVDFARAKSLRLVVKGGAHSYLGQSNAPDSLLVWTRRLDAIEMHDAFVPANCAGAIAPQPAVSIGAGAKFIQLYDRVVTQGGRFVQGGGCTSVGVGGHVQTGGFGSFSKYGGLVAASLLEAEIVTADGRVRIANACTHPDLFLALKGGGAGFGITTRLTLATRDLPERAGFFGWSLRATSDADFRALVAAFCTFAQDRLINPHWGEQVALAPDNVLAIAMVFQGLSDAEAHATWEPLRRWIAAQDGRIAEVARPRIVSMPARHWWDFAYRKAHVPQSIIEDTRPGAAPGRFWWAGNAGEVSLYLTGYESVWLSERLLAADRRGGLVDALFAASRHFEVSLHFNKGLAGATEARRREARETSIHPDAVDAFALALVASGQPRAFPGVPGHEPDVVAGRASAAKIAAAFAELRTIAPRAGSYSSEMSFFEKKWQEAAWGPNYDRLLAAKMKYDPQGLFTGHHQVGSEYWSEDGFTRLK
ncbi:FAD-binding protein [Aquabacter spiritensis]|uniref:FAD/FMN-containing dehydrogenase n=1 Tax=Aquabacter spiritensis TaxID=933073 RepID=A0A4V2UWR2_9HYPH|nr:FAD-binding protein [Aquabacter spiritensis]TCT00618.1 FAD/FMN-containing dehydrogenase [Aquabacter spiritensis]